MRIPAFLIEHPLEALIAGVLLVVMLFGSSDRHAAEVAAQHPAAQVAAMDKM
jgi:hypothetical protein